MVKRQPDPPRTTASFSHSLVTLCSSRSSVSSAPFLLPLSRSLSLPLSLPPTLSLSPSPGSVSDRPFSPISRIPSERTILPRSRSILTLFEPVSLPSLPPSPPPRPTLELDPAERVSSARPPLPPPFHVTECTFGGERCSRQGFSRHAPEKKISCRYAGREGKIGGKRNGRIFVFVSFPRHGAGGKKKKKIFTLRVTGYLVSKSRSKITQNHLFVSFSLSLVQLRRILYIYIYIY